MNDIQIAELARRLTDLENKVGKDNFSARQDFSKMVDCRTRLKVPHYSSTPTTTSEIGEIIEVGGVLYICTATTPTWTKVGTQT